MSAISERVGGSKATLYGYFSSKEDLLRAVLEHDVAEETERLLSAFPTGIDLRSELIELGVRYLTSRLSDLPITNFRTVSNQPPENGIGRDFYAGILRPAWDLLARHFEMLMGEGRLAQADPWQAAMHWRGLVECEVLEKRLLGVIANPDLEEVRRHATDAADAFLKIYGTGNTPKPEGESVGAA
jgi:AcrR family transcriptional regulator